MGGAPGTGLTLSSIREYVREQIGGPAVAVQSAADELVDTTLRWWPERRMAEIARRGSEGAGPDALDAIAVISAKVREDVEHRWRMSPNTTSALDLLCMAVVAEIANLWFSSADARIEMRAIMFTLRRRRP